MPNPKLVKRSLLVTLATGLCGLGCSRTPATVGLPDAAVADGGAGGRAGGAADTGVGAAGADGGAAADGASVDPGPTIDPLPDSMTEPGEVPLRPLTRREYTNTVRDLLGVTVTLFTSVESRFPYDQESYESGFLQGGAVSIVDEAQAIMTSAEQIAAAFAPKLPAMLAGTIAVMHDGASPCSPVPAAEPDRETCADAFIMRFGRRAFRRPLSKTEVARYHALYKTERSAEIGASFEEALGDVVAAMLQAPQFLYHHEQGTNAPIKDGAFVSLNAYERASRLSYLFWASMPDEELLAAADADALASTTQIVRQARRLLADERAKDGIAEFHDQWLEIGSLDHPRNPAEQVMLEETRQFVRGVFFAPGTDGTLVTLLTSPASFVDASLAKLYGVAAPAGPGLQPVTLDPLQRPGVLTRAAFLTAKADAVDSNPVLRGDAILRRLLCTELPEPSNIVIPPVPAVDPRWTTRQRYEMHGMQSCAAACHSIIDPLGYAFENYDGTGAYRTIDNGHPVDASGSISLDGGVQLEFRNAIDLVGQLARHERVRQCMATEWLRYMLGRREVSGEAPSQKALADLLRASGDDLRELVVGLTRSRPFTHRTLSPGEVAP
jgi:hypothetical protein